MVLVVRNDLKMGKGNVNPYKKKNLFYNYCNNFLGKIGAQCGHASVGAYETAMAKNPALVRRWDESGCAKICLKVESEKELMTFRKGASVRGLNYYLVHDAGRTQIAAGSATVLAIGPALVEEVDVLTSHLKLL